MTTYYIRKDGSDANAGTANTAVGAWRTLEHARAEMAAGDEVVLAEDVYYMGNHLTGPDYIMAVGDGTPVIDCSPGGMPPTPESLIGEYCIFRDEGTEGYRIVDVDDVNETITVERNFPSTLVEQMYIADLMNPTNAPYTWDVSGVAGENKFSVLRGESNSAKAMIKREANSGEGEYTLLISADVANQKFKWLIFDGNSQLGGLLDASAAASQRLLCVCQCTFQNGGGLTDDVGWMARINDANIIAAFMGCEFTNWKTGTNKQGVALQYYYGNGMIENCYFHDTTITSTSTLTAIGVQNTFQTVLIINSILNNLNNTENGYCVGIGCNAIEGLACINNTINNLSSGGGNAIGISFYIASPGKLNQWSIANNIIANCDYGIKEVTNNTLSIAECDYNWLYKVTTPHDPANAAGDHDVTGIDPSLRDPSGGDFTPLNMQCYRAGKPDWLGTPTHVGAISRPTQARRMSGAFNSNICGVF